jgi:putative tryptophan/tyrosine transport system substrate-binding protein
MEAIIAGPPELNSVVAAQAREPNTGLIVIPETFTLVHRVELTSLVARHRLPAVYPLRFFAELGGLLSHGIVQTDNFRRAATYADRILRGAKPSELPVQAPVFDIMAVILAHKSRWFDAIALTVLHDCHTQL